MANNKLHGYTPKSEKFENGNRLDQVNPYEFRKGMDYELVEMGCDRLSESTPEERMKSTEKVLKNLSEHSGYYTNLIHYLTEFRNTKNKPNFKRWLKELGEANELIPLTKKDKLKESLKMKIKKRIMKEMKLSEQSDDFEDFDFDKDDVNPDLGADRQAHKSGTKKGKGVKGLESEAEKLEKEKEGLKDKMFPLIQAFKSKKKGKKPYGKADYESDLSKIKTSDKSSAATDEGKDHVTDRIKAINKRLEEIEKEKEDIVLKEKKDRRAVAETVMDRAVHKELLKIVEECGISMNEGASAIKPYYEIAKMSYMEGLTAGLRNE